MASVIKYDTTPTECSCPDWYYRPHRRPCKHVETLLDAMAVVREWQDHNEELLPLALTRDAKSPFTVVIP